MGNRSKRQNPRGTESARVFQRILYLTVYDVETTNGFSGLWDIRKKDRSMSNDEVVLNEDQLIESSLEDSSDLKEEGELLANGFHIIPSENIKRVY